MTMNRYEFDWGVVRMLDPDYEKYLYNIYYPGYESESASNESDIDVDTVQTNPPLHIRGASEMNEEELDIVNLMKDTSENEEVEEEEKKKIDEDDEDEDDCVDEYLAQSKARILEIQNEKYGVPALGYKLKSEYLDPPAAKNPILLHSLDKLHPTQHRFWFQ